MLFPAEDEEEYEMDREGPYQRPARDWKEEDGSEDEEEGLQMKPCAKKLK